LLKAVEENDVVLLNAGSSAGRDDYTKTIIAENGAVFCHGIAIRPGKPTVLGVCGHTPVIGVPGYPVSAAVVLEHLVFPTIELLTKNILSSADTVRATLSRKVVSSLKYQEFMRVKLAFIQDRLMASPVGRGAGAVASLAKCDGTAVIPCDSEVLEAGDEVEVFVLRPMEEIRRAVAVTGSHDPMLDIIGDIMRRRSDYFLSSAHVGSMGGIMAIMRDEAHIAPIHLLDTATGEYNVSFVEKYFSGNVTLVKGVKRTQGIMVRKGNPKGIKGISDIVGVTYVNRQKGAGTRILLDFLLEKRDMSAAGIRGYDNEEYTHTAVAAKIAAGNADAGLGIYAAAQIFGLDFIPIAEEEYDFLIKTDMMGLPQIQAFLEVLRSDGLRGKLEELGGYTVL
jgi:putative molybdopterin biosynthesis protein